MGNDNASLGMKKQLKNPTYPDNVKKPKFRCEGKMNARERAKSHWNHYLSSVKSPCVHGEISERDVEYFVSYLHRK